MGELPFISVIIPTYNRAEWVKKCIISLLEQEYPSKLFEIIIVDNASKDNTAPMVKSFLSSEKPFIYYFYEPTPGSNFARNTGALNSQGDILGFIDDDAVADSSWLSYISQTFIDSDDIVAVSGGIELDWEIPKPAWIPNKYESFLGRNLHLGINRRDLLPSEPVFEGNLAIRKSIFNTLKGFDIRFGMVGEKIGANDGTCLIDKIHNLGRVVYQPDALIYHHVPKSRIRPSYFLKRSFYQGIGDASIIQTRQQRNKQGLIRALANDCIFLLKEIFSFIITLFKFSQSQYLEKLIVVYNRFGVIKQRFELIFARNLNINAPSK